MSTSDEEEEVEGPDDMKTIQNHFDSQKQKAVPKKVKKGQETLFSSLHPPIEVKNYKITKHFKEKKELLLLHTDRFEKWYWYLENGFSILLHGYGSKSLLLQLFASSCNRLHSTRQETNSKHRRLVQPLICTVHGWSLQTDLKKLIDSLMKEWLGWDSNRIIQEKRKLGSKLTLEDCCLTMIRNAENRRRPLVLIVESLDSENLRIKSCQQALSCLASSPYVYFIASIDHINAPILWDRKDSNRFNFIYQDASTFLPYILETRNFSSPEVCPKALSNLSTSRGVAYVLQSLTPTHISILKELGKRQLEGEGKKNKIGEEFHSFYKYCLTMMWVTSEANLKQYLREFHDHHLIKQINRNGKEYLLVDASKEVIESEILGIKKKEEEDVKKVKVDDNDEDEEE